MSTLTETVLASASASQLNAIPNYQFTGVKEKLFALIGGYVLQCGLPSGLWVDFNQDQQPPLFTTIVCNNNYIYANSAYRKSNQTHTYTNYICAIDNGLWIEMPHSKNMISMAANHSNVFGVDADGLTWYRGDGPSAEWFSFNQYSDTPKVRVLVAFGGNVYAATPKTKLSGRPCRTSSSHQTSFGSPPIMMD